MINYGDTAINRRAKLHLLLFLGQIKGDYIVYVKEIAYFTWFALIRNASGGKRSTKVGFLLGDLHLMKYVYLRAEKCLSSSSQDASFFV